MAIEILHFAAGRPLGERQQETETIKK